MVISATSLKTTKKEDQHISYEHGAEPPEDFHVKFQNATELKLQREHIIALYSSDTQVSGQLREISKLQTLSILIPAQISVVTCVM